MELRDIKEKINAFYHLDITDRNRQRHYANARKLYCYMANKYNHSYIGAGRFIGIKHDAVIYHSNLAKKWIQQGDKDFIKQVEEVFNYKVGKTSNEKKLSQIHKVYDPLLLDIPAGLHKEILDKVKLMIKVHNMKQSKNELKEYVAKGMDMSNHCF